MIDIKIGNIFVKQMLVHQGEYGQPRSEHLSVRVTPDVKREFAALARENGMTMSDAGNQALLAYLQANRKQ